MLILHVTICFAALMAGALVLYGLCRGARLPIWETLLLVSTAIISLTGLALPSPPGTPTPDPARVLSVVELVVVAVAALTALGRAPSTVRHATRVLSLVLAVYLNAFVGVVQAFGKIGALHALAPTGKELPVLLAQGLTLAIFGILGVIALRRSAVRRAAVVSPARS